MVGVPELLIILAIVLVVFGASKLPAIGDALGRSIKNFKRASQGADELEVSEKKEVEGKDASRAELKAKAVEVEDAEVVASKKKAD
jgi:sec-independent protein translocase protein TatA